MAQTTKVSHFYLDKYPLTDRRVPILDTERSTIAGVGIPNLYENVPENRRNEIKAALEKLTFLVRYDVNTKMERRLVVKPEVRMSLSTQDKHSIAWAADDIKQHKFDASFIGTSGSRETIADCTVYGYFDRRYGIRLQYPSLPIIRTRIGWFPVELLFQSFAIMKGADDDAQKRAVLQYHDQHSGEKRIYQERHIRSKMSGQLTLEKEFGFKYSGENLKNQAAKLLAEPTLIFGGNEESDPANGSWNLASSRKLYK